MGLLCSRYQDRFFLSVSATTRSPRPGEIDGQSYLFMDQDEFEQLVAQGAMLEWAKVHGLNYYGTPRRPVEEALEQGKPALLEIDLAGARQVKESWPEAYMIFLAPPSWEELERRLVGRGTESPAEQARRIETARVEMDAQDEFDRVIINDDLETCVAELAQIMGLA